VVFLLTPALSLHSSDCLRRIESFCHAAGINELELTNCNQRRSRRTRQSREPFF